MTKWTRSAMVFGIGLLFLFIQTSPTLAIGPEITRDTRFVPGEVLMKVLPGKGQAMATVAQTVGKKVGARVARLHGNVALLSADPDADVPGLVRKLSAEPGVQYAQPNYIYWIPEENPRGKKLTEFQVTRKMGGTEKKLSNRDLLAMRTRVGRRTLGTYPGDAGYDWGFWWTWNDIIWPDLAPSPAVCVVDTGVDALHPDLSGNVLAGWNFLTNNNNTSDDNGHGTHVAGIIAAKINNTTVPAFEYSRSGLSRSKILPVKVLSAQGWGTSYWVGRGIKYCADNAAVKVINMSLGGYDADQYEYDMLKYATTDRYNSLHQVIYKGKLVVVAAGNGDEFSFPYGTNRPSYPAAWSDPAVGHLNGTNEISDRVVAVGAMRSPNGPVWIDGDGNGVNEDEDTSDCAAEFSNFGSWIQMVAPGEDIISTTPYNKPFYAGYFYAAQPGYDFWSGTSMAAPHVAAGAARAWSVWPNENATQIKARLIDSGDSLNTAEQYPTWDGAYTGDAPFCWPSDMSASRSLNFAKLMQREGLMGAVVDSTTGLPLMGSTVQVYQGTLLKSTAALTSPWANEWAAINLKQDTIYTVKVSKPGYTSGYQTLGDVQTGSGGNYSTSSPIYAGIPPATPNTAVVATSLYEYDVDLFAWLPSNALPPSTDLYYVYNPPAEGGIVGGELPFNPYPAEYLGPGALFGFPWAVWTREGGYEDDIMAETVTVAPRPGFPNALYFPSAPLASPPVNDYQFFIYNWDALLSGESCDYFGNDGADESACMPPLTFRVWRGGVIKDQFTFDNGSNEYDPGHCGVDEFWYQPFSISSTGVITRANVCGDDTILPYATF